jgi:poly-gamma-glutamate synthesis protein (capsule biosynthesis protein)
MNVERDRKILSFIMVATGVLIFVLVIGIVIFSLPDTTGTYDPSQVETTGITPETEKPTEETDVTFRTDDETKTEAAGIIQASTEISVEPVRLHLIAYGDNLLHKGISEYSQLPDGSYDFSSIYSDISTTVSAADIAIVNQEVPVGGVELGISGYPNFNAPHEAVNALAGAGFDVLTLATNHMLDKGADGVISTLNYIRQTFPDILTTGAYLSAEEREIVPVTEVSGIRVAFLNYTYGLNGNDSARVFINVIQDDLILADVARAREQADYVVVAMHWGEENQTTPTDEQQRLARLLADAGVDLVIGTHPHVVQPVEVLTGADGHQTIVYYSLGNLVSLQHAAGNMLGGVAEVTATFVDGVLQDSSYEYSFVVTQWDENHAGSHVYPWESYTPELAAVHGITQFDASFSYEALSQMIEQALQ